jgi:hypothetical protein
VAAVKWIVAVICGLAGVGALAAGLLDAPHPGPLAFKASVEPVEVRALPTLTGPVLVGAGAATTPSLADPPGEPAIDPAMVANKALDAGVKTGAAIAAVPAAGPSKADAGTKGPAAGPAAVAAAPVGEGVMNLQASDTADIYVDGRKVGASPIMGFKTKAGTHKVRFDCYDAAGNAMTGQVKVVLVSPEKDQDVEFTCPDPQ